MPESMTAPNAVSGVAAPSVADAASAALAVVAARAAAVGGAAHHVPDRAPALSATQRRRRSLHCMPRPQPSRNQQHRVARGDAGLVLRSGSAPARPA